MKYEAEKNILVKAIEQIYIKYSRNGLGNVVQKTQFDLVTDIDCGIEYELAQIIRQNFPQDKIHGEETSSDQIIEGRTWTIDPIDGTCNMASSIPLYGVQCALFENSEVVFSIIYLPHFDELFFAEQGAGCYLNGKRVFVKQNEDINNAIVSFGDYRISVSANCQNSYVWRRVHRLFFRRLWQNRWNSRHYQKLVGYCSRYPNVQRGGRFAYQS